MTAQVIDIRPWLDRGTWRTPQEWCDPGLHLRLAERHITNLAAELNLDPHAASNERVSAELARWGHWSLSATEKALLFEGYLCAVRNADDAAADDALHELLNGRNGGAA